MRLTILGGGGFRTPLVTGAVARAGDRVPITEIVLHDLDEARLRVIAAVAHQEASPGGPRITIEPDLRRAVTGAAIVFSAIRVGGTPGRVRDESVARELGLLGQETIGAGGLAYGLRTVPVVDRIAQTIADVAPAAWVVNFTNPAGLVTEAMRTHLGARVFGICDTPIGLLRSAAHALGLPAAEVTGDYLGLNHLGWLRSVIHRGVDRLPELMADREGLLQLDEAALFDVEWLQAIGQLPGEYLHYYEPAAAHAPSGESRGEFLLRQQAAFFEAGADGEAGQRWKEALAEREETYMADARTREHAQEQRQGGGYHEVAVDLMAALLGGEPAWMILDLANDGVIGALPDDAVIEVAATVDSSGARVAGDPAPLRLEQLGLVAGVKASERLIIEAARTGSCDLAWRAFAEHPLVRSPDLGRRLLAAYDPDFTADPASLRFHR